MFLHLSVSHSVHRGWGSASVHAGIPSLPGTRQAPPRPSTPRTMQPRGKRQAPPGPGTPPPDQAHTPRDQAHTPSRRLCLRTVRILLECILVQFVFKLSESEQDFD